MGTDTPAPQLVGASLTCVLLALAVSGCVGATEVGAPSTSAASTQIGAPTTGGPTYLDWLAGEGDGHIRAIWAASQALGPGYQTVTVEQCAGLQSAVDEAVAWTGTHKPDDAEIDRAWQSALTSYGQAATSCTDVVDNRDSRSALESATAYLDVRKSTTAGAVAVRELIKRVGDLVNAR